MRGTPSGYWNSDRRIFNYYYELTVIFIIIKEKKQYCEYIPGKRLKEAFSDERIPLMTMDHLRALDFPISRNISYERTVDEFLVQLATNDTLRPLRNRSEMVVLLNEEGALILNQGQWTLYFTPDKRECSTLSENANLYAVLKSQHARLKKGEVTSVIVPERSLKALVAGTSPFCILDEYCKKEPGRYLRVAEKIVVEGTDTLFKNVPVCSYNKLYTVDKSEIENYNTIQALMDEYILRCNSAEPGEQIQPLSIAVFGYPGSGKSFGVRQIAATSGIFEVSSINLSQCGDPQDFFEALDEAINCEKGRIPLVFFDEFDCELDGIPRGWLRYFLAPMQDGEYTTKGKTRIIDRAVFVFAGGTAHTFKEFNSRNGTEDYAAFVKVKGPDFVSRLKGILNVRSLNRTDASDRSYIIRRAMVLRTQIVRNVPSIYEPETGIVNISHSLLSALLRVSEYRHDARSLAFVLAMCRLSSEKRFTPSNLPMDSQLDIHLDVEDFRRKLIFEQIMGEMVETYARTAHENYQKRWLELQSLQAENTGADYLSASVQEDLVDWDHLKECYKESYRSRIRYMGEYLVSFDTRIGIRPIVPNSTDAVTELYGPDLEELSRVEHERWMNDKYMDGWQAGDSDPELKHSNELVPYEELTEETRDFIRREIRQMPILLREIGYELYHKSY